MRNLHLTYFLPFLTLIIIGCNSKKKEFNPEEPGVTDISIMPSTNDSLLGENTVKLTIMVQKTNNDFPQNAVQALESRLLTIASKNGIVGYGGDPAFVFAALITPLSKDVTTTPPVKQIIKYTMNLYVANIVTGDVYGSYSTELMGVGKSFDWAAVNAVSSVSDNNQIQKMLHDASEKIISWFNEHSNEFISKVNDYIIHEDYDKAYALLASVPSQATECFQFAQENKSKIYEQYLQKVSNDYYRLMLDEIAKSQTEYSPIVGGYYQMIPHNAPNYEKAKDTYESYIANIIRTSEVERDRNFYLERERVEARKLEIQAQIAASEAMQEENVISSQPRTGNNIVNMIIEQAVQIGVPQLLTMLI